MSWLSIATIRAEAAARSVDLARVGQSDRERHWLAALRLPRAIATHGTEPAGAIASEAHGAICR
jgi:hypothetical protein